MAIGQSAPRTATLHEIFSGIQGEGMLVGVRQLFVRFHGCHTHCRYCDTPAALAQPPAACQVEETAASRRFLSQANPFSVPALLARLRALHAGFPHHSVSVTGGEPLLHRPFLDALLPAMHAEGFRSFLETNGLLPGEMAALACPPHYIAMDCKLPSVAGVTPSWEAHGEFLDAALAQVTRDIPIDTRGMRWEERLQVKLVFGEESLADIARAAELLAGIRPQIPCILQPVTPRPGGPAAPTERTVLEAQRLAAARLSCVRVIPQTHVMLGQR